MGKLEFGISSVWLGPAAEQAPRGKMNPEEWNGAVIDSFYRAGGTLLSEGSCWQVSPTECRFLWDASCLYVLFVCGEGPEPAWETQGAARKETGAEKESPEAAWETRGTAEEPPAAFLAREDRVEIAVQSGSFGPRDFAVFGADRRGRSRGEQQFGMTYLGGDQAYRGGAERLDNRARVVALEEGRYVSRVTRERGCWKAYFALPWELLGGFPEGSFGLMVYRRKKQTGEVLTPFPLDLNVNFSDRFEYDPLTFLEARPGGTPGVGRGEEVLFSLPGGRRLWQRPGFLCWPEEEEREEILALQETELPTGPDSLGRRIYLAQRWQDTLMLEGMDFFFNQARANPWEPREPWVDRRLCNQALAEGDTAEACRILDRYLDFLRRVTAWWYADHSLGNRRRESWTALENLEECRREEGGLALCFQTKEGSRRELFCTADGKAYRFRAGGSGFFAGERGELHCRETGEGIWEVSSGAGRLEIRMGEAWEISAVIGSGKEGHGEGGAGKDRGVQEEDRGQEKDSELEKDVVQEEDGAQAEDAGQGIIRRTERKRLFGAGDILLLGEGPEEIRGFDLYWKLEKESFVYGFGERFDGLHQRGRILTLWQRDACEGCLASIGNQSYKNIPLLHDSAGYSLFFNTHYRIRADVGQENPDRMRITGMGPVLDFFVWCGEPGQVMQDYARLTGAPLLPPRWVFEPWAGGGAGRWYHGPLKDLCREQMAVLERFEELDIPHSGFYAEGAGAGWIGRGGKEELYKIVDFAGGKGIRVFSWQYPDISRETAGALLPKVPQEELPVTENLTDGLCPEHPLPRVIDFTHPRAMELLKAQWAERLDAGIRGSMVDFGDVVPDEAVFYDGRRGAEMHNGYAYEYARSYRELFEERYGEDHVLFTRGAAAGSQHFACQFGGDQQANFLGMTYAIYGGLSAAASGLPFWGVDAGGYDGFGDEETYIRWTEYACFCPLMRYHGTKPREPWEYSPETVEIYRFYAWLRENLLPYSYDWAVHAHVEGIPMMLPMAMAFPGQGEILGCDDQYLFGKYLLVAPVHSESCVRRISFPRGRWVSFWDNKECVEGPVSVEREVPLGSIPVYLRAGALIPLQLNGSLEPGRSMSGSRKNALLITPPEEDGGDCWYRSSSDVSHYCFRRKKEGFELLCDGMGEIQYLILKGLPGNFSEKSSGEPFGKSSGEPSGNFSEKSSGGSSGKSSGEPSGRFSEKFPGRPSGIRLNGRPMREEAARHALYFEEGWFEETDGTVLIRLFRHEKIRLEVDGFSCLAPPSNGIIWQQVRILSPI